MNHENGTPLQIVLLGGALEYWDQSAGYLSVVFGRRVARGGAEGNHWPNRAISEPFQMVTIRLWLLCRLFRPVASMKPRYYRQLQTEEQERKLEKQPRRLSLGRPGVVWIAVHGQCHSRRMLRIIATCDLRDCGDWLKIFEVFDAGLV